VGWAAFAQMFAGFVGGLGQQVVSQAADRATTTIDQANTDAQNLINQTNADAANLLRSSNNNFVAAQASMSNLLRSISNQNKQIAIGKQIDAVTTNIARLQDQAVRGNLAQQLQSASQLGAVRAQAAANGVGGTTAKMIQMTMQAGALSNQNATKTQQGYQTYDMLLQRAGLQGNMFSAMNEGQTFAPIDYTTNVAQLVQAPIRASQFNNTSAWDLALANVDWSKMGKLGSTRTPSDGYNPAGGIGDSGGYASGALLNGTQNTTFDAYRSGSSFGVGNNDYGFFGGQSNGFYSTSVGDSGSVQNFTLS
jgi:hypothetical protein